MAVTPSSTGAARLRAAFGHSMRGMRDTWRSEAAFRQEAVLAACVVPAVCLLDIAPLWRALLLVTLGLVFVVELLNTAVEAAIDRIGVDRHPLSGKAKDAGSAAVTVSLLLHAAVWACLLW
ncbi:MAG: diacylglycerol kinase [Luteimonas sp.]